MDHYELIVKGATTMNGVLNWGLLSVAAAAVCIACVWKIKNSRKKEKREIDLKSIRSL